MSSGANFSNVDNANGVGSGAALTAGGIDYVVFGSQAIATASPLTSPIFYTAGAALVFFVNVTAIGTGALVVQCFGIDPASGQRVLLLATASIAANGITMYQIGPGLPVTANASVNALVPRQIQFVATSTTGPVTASVGASVVAE